MRTLTVTILLSIASLGCHAQSSPPKLTAEQKVALYQSRDRLNAALEKVKATPEYAEYQKAQEAQQAALQSALKGIDQKKWALQPDLEFTAVAAPSTPVAKPEAKK